MPLKIDSLISSSVNTQTILLNGVDNCKTTTPIYENYPFIVQPTFSKTCTQIINNSQNGAPNLKGYKLMGTVQLDSDTSYSVYLGTIRLINGAIYPAFPISWKISGSVYWSVPAPVLITEPLGRINRGWDTDGDSILIESEFVNFYTTDGDDLLVDVVLFVDRSEIAPNLLVGDLNANISFEIETLIFEEQDATYEYIPLP